jgi:hypothetical protein
MIPKTQLRLQFFAYAAALGELTRFPAEQQQISAENLFVQKWLGFGLGKFHPWRYTPFLAQKNNSF